MWWCTLSRIWVEKRWSGGQLLYFKVHNLCIFLRKKFWEIRAAAADIGHAGRDAYQPAVHVDNKVLIPSQPNFYVRKKWISRILQKGSFGFCYGPISGQLMCPTHKNYRAFTNSATLTFFNIVTFLTESDLRVAMNHLIAATCDKSRLKSSGFHTSDIEH